MRQNESIGGSWWLFWGTSIQGVHTAEQKTKSRNRYNYGCGGPGRAGG